MDEKIVAALKAEIESDACDTQKALKLIQEAATVGNRDLVLLAAKNRRTAIFDALLEKKAPASAYTLMWAAYHGDRHMCRELLARGADTKARDTQGYTALFFAEQRKHGDIAEMIRACEEGYVLAGKKILEHESPPLHNRRIVSIFNFESGERHVIVENTLRHTESSALVPFSATERNVMEKACAAFRALGGDVEAPHYASHAVLKKRRAAPGIG